MRSVILYAAVLMLVGVLLAQAIWGSQQARLSPVEQARQVSVKVKLPNGGHGSGVVIASDGRIITNQHVCARFTKLIVEKSDGTMVVAKVLWNGEINTFDLCLMQAENVDTKGNPVTWSVAKLRVRTVYAGMPVFHIGNMMQVRELISFGNMGRLTSLGWNGEPAMDFVGMAGPGSSGGGVFDMEGNLVGLVYSGVQIRTFGGTVPLGVAQVIPVSMIKLLLGR